MNKFFFDKNNEYIEAKAGVCILSENNLKVQANYAMDIGTGIPVDKERSYWEVRVLSGNESGWAGLVTNKRTNNTERLALRFFLSGYYSNSFNAVQKLTDYFPVMNSVIGVAFNSNTKEVKIYINGILGGSIILISPEKVFYPAIGNSNSGDSAGIAAIANFGAKPFVYPIPAGYQPLDMVPRKHLYIKDDTAYGTIL